MGEPAKIDQNMRYHVKIEGLDADGTLTHTFDVPSIDAFRVNVSLNPISAEEPSRTKHADEEERRHWLEDGWSTSMARGNHYRNTDDDFFVVIYQSKAGDWYALVTGNQKGATRTTMFDSQDGAKLASFDMLRRLKRAREGHST